MSILPVPVQPVGEISFPVSFRKVLCDAGFQDPLKQSKYPSSNGSMDSGIIFLLLRRAHAKE